MSRNTLLYAVLFAGAVCVVCAVVVSSSAVSLKPLQDANQELDRKENVLKAAGLVDADEKLTPELVAEKFKEIKTVAVDLRTGQEDPDFQVEGYDPQKALKDPSASFEVPANPAKVHRVPNYQLVYKVVDPDGKLRMLVLPVEGKGLWSTLYGFLALDADLNTIRGLTFYQHGETPGLGGEVDNRTWKALWPGRKAYKDDVPVIAVVRGRAGPPSEDPYKVDGLSGATITSRGVTHLVQFWLGENGFEPYIDRLRKEGA
ncbi:MAG: Na(+)-translocating NADH-quinone reductase subunit C [Acidobacteriota bacterium]|jgi:Na+-transporting NADH:ubiquinone oxidoreductase subunit C